MKSVSVTGVPGAWYVTLGDGLGSAAYKDLTPGRSEEDALARAKVVAESRSSASASSAYTSNLFLFGASGIARSNDMNKGGLFGEDQAAAERALMESGNE